jgi:hypothetical protein
MNTNAPKGKTGDSGFKRFMRKVTLVIVVLILLTSTGYYFYRNFTVSEGTRIGLLYKISKKGILFKTYEGQVQLAGATVMSKESAWEFSVVDKYTYQTLQQLEGKTVRLYYKEKVDAFPWQGETNYLVYKAEQLKN